ncbi:MAG TPA: hypothetical protein VFS77_07365, partial [Pyrinomonadaceae bacterium]|nr:hypothetical protein [Pyrinomonadaceae bacterium]
MFLRLLVVFLLLFCFISSSVAVQTQQKSAKNSKPKTEEVDEEAAQRRTMAISLVTTLADEARRFKDQTRRARVQARAADVLWETDPERSRELFRRAWEAADIVDAESARQRAEQIKRMQEGGEPLVIRGGPDLRSEVLRLVAKRDRKLGEEFLKALDEANAKASEEASAQTRRGSTTELGSSKRLQLARQLVADGEIDRAIQFATPALTKVHLDSIFFLSALREKNAQMADQAFTNLLALAARDPLSDANTVSGLSSYVLTPFFYVQFEPSGGANQNQSR